MRLRASIVLPALALIHAGVWAYGLATLPFTWLPRAALAQYLSSFALVVASLNLLLSTRARIFEGPFGGLDKMFASHRADGIVVACVLAAHAILVPITLPLASGRLVGVAAFTLIVGSVIFAITPRSPWRNLLYTRYELWKDEHRFMGVFVLVAVVHSLMVPTLPRLMPAVRLWVYGFAVLGLLAYAYRQTVFRVWARRHAYVIADARPLGKRVLEVNLRAVRAPIGHRAGQFAFVRFEAGPTHERHPFTISEPPMEGSLRFSVEMLGDWTARLHLNGLPSGSSASIEGPYGRYDYRVGRRRQMWLAGGIGITPFLAFLPTVDDSHDIALVWSVHDPDEAAYREEIETLVAEKPNVTFTLWPSKERGHLAFEQLGVEQPTEMSFYLCGPVAMRDAFVTQLLATGVKKRDIHYEEFTLR